VRGMIRAALSLTLTVAAGPGASAAPPLPATAGSLAVACEAQAARYEGGKGFSALVIRAGEVKIDNPLRPLTPDLTHVLEVVIGGKRASAYGPDYASLRRGGPPGAMQASLGAPIRWEPALPALPDSLGIVADDGTVLATLAFRACEPQPAIAPEPVPKVAKSPAKGTGKAAKAAKAGSKAAPKAAEKTPGGFTMPSGAIPE
jgi:hypothetical protein